MRNESTAIVNLVDLVKQRPLPVTTDDDELFGGVARFDPMAMPVVAEPVSLPQFEQRVRISPPLGVRREEEAPRMALLKKAAIPTGIFVGAMIVLSIYLAMRGDEPTHTAANVTVVHAPPAAPVIQPIETPAPSVQPIEEAKPVAEAAPVAAPVVEEAKPTFEPTVPTVPDVAEVAPVEEQVAEKRVAKKTSRAKRAAMRAKSATRVAVAEKPKATKQNLGGNGALSVSSSPAREVWVDGRNTKSMTPQRLTLKPGTHNITLFDKKTRSAKTFQVEIKPNELTRVAKKY
jgi:hypothetical protein